MLDLYCGLGNFSLPLATRAGEVLGLDFDAPMISRARHNAAAAGLENTRFEQADLSDAESDPENLHWQDGASNAILHRISKVMRVYVRPTRTYGDEW